MAPKRKRSRPNSSENGILVLDSADGEEKFTFFYGKSAPFSNFLPSKFTINNVEFGCTEQYFHYKKAGKSVIVVSFIRNCVTKPQTLEHFGDNKIMTDLLNAENPAVQKRLGRKVQGYIEEEWKKVGPIYMKEACLAKVISLFKVVNFFGQNIAGFLYFSLCKMKN